jgi:hypothetical protein
MRIRADQLAALAGKWLIIVSLIAGIFYYLCSYDAVLRFVSLVASALIALFCLISCAWALIWRDAPLLKRRAVAFAILVFPVLATLANGKFHLMDRAYVLFSDDCPKDGVSPGDGHVVSACRIRDWEGWAQIETVIYDSSDQVALPRGRQSRAWWSAVSHLRMPFDQFEFRAFPLGSHYYAVDFDEDRPYFAASK